MVVSIILIVLSGLLLFYQWLANGVGSKSLSVLHLQLASTNTGRWIINNLGNIIIHFGLILFFVSLLFLVGFVYYKIVDSRGGFLDSNNNEDSSIKFIVKGYSIVAVIFVIFAFLSLC